MITDEIIQKVVCEYNVKHSLYSAFTSKLQHLVTELLQERSFTPHSVTSRIKSEQSLCDKLRRPDSEYGKLGDVTDVSGVRIITYFNDDVDKVANYLEGEFEIVREHSVDRRKMLDADRFGYLSLHYIVKLPHERLKLTEYRRFVNLFCEIQVRSVLQHAWAEIEHDLGYKTRIAVPQPLRRRFSRLAGLLELADEEFLTIREALARYREDLPREIAASPAEVTLDKLSLEAFLQSNRTVAKLDGEIALLFGAKGMRKGKNTENDLLALKFFQIQTIEDLEKALTTNMHSILSFAKLWIERKESSTLVGVCLLYLYYILAAQSGSVGHVMSFMDHYNLGEPQLRKARAEKALKTYAITQNKALRQS